MPNNANTAPASSPSPKDNLIQAGVTLPEAKAPAGAAYVPYTISGNQVFISGQLPLKDGTMTKTGHLGANVSLEEGKETAKICAINILSQLKAACKGDLSRVTKVIKLEILVSCTPDFTDPHVVANGASELMKLTFGEEKGAHARVAYGVSSLPMGAAVEVSATFEIA